MSDSFQNAVLAAAQASGIVAADAEAADAAAAASDAEPEDAPSPDDALAEEEDDVEDGDDLTAEADEEDAESDDERSWRERYQELADRQARYEAERLAREQEQTRREWAQAETNLDGWLRQSLGQLASERAQDERLIAGSEDPNALRAHLTVVRQQTENWIWGQYRQQKSVYDQHKHGAVMAALAQTQLQQWAEQTAQNYGLPKSIVPRLLRYADGTPVHPDAIPARAYELAESRREERNARRRVSQAERSQKAAELRGVPSPGSGQAQSAPMEFASWRDALKFGVETLGIKP